MLHAALNPRYWAILVNTGCNYNAKQNGPVFVILFSCPISWGANLYFLCSMKSCAVLCCNYTIQHVLFVIIYHDWVIVISWLWLIALYKIYYLWTLSIMTESLWNHDHKHMVAGKLQHSPTCSCSLATKRQQCPLHTASTCWLSTQRCSRSCFRKLISSRGSRIMISWISFLMPLRSSVRLWGFCRRHQSQAEEQRRIQWWQWHPFIDAFV